MKQKLISLLAALLALLMLFSGCAAHGKTLIEAGDEKISINVFQLYLSIAISIEMYNEGFAAVLKYNVDGPILGRNKGSYFFFSVNDNSCSNRLNSSC